MWRKLPQRSRGCQRERTTPASGRSSACVPHDLRKRAPLPGGSRNERTSRRDPIFERLATPVRSARTTIGPDRNPSTAIGRPDASLSLSLSLSLSFAWALSWTGRGRGVDGRGRGRRRGRYRHTGSSSRRPITSTVVTSAYLGPARTRPQPSSASRDRFRRVRPLSPRPLFASRRALVGEVTLPRASAGTFVGSSGLTRSVWKRARGERSLRR